MNGFGGFIRFPSAADEHFQGNFPNLEVVAQSLAVQFVYGFIDHGHATTATVVDLGQGGVCRIENAIDQLNFGFEGVGGRHFKRATVSAGDDFSGAGVSLTGAVFLGMLESNDLFRF